MSPGLTYYANSPKQAVTICTRSAVIETDNEV